MKPIYKKLKFKDKADFQKWLDKTTDYIICFQDDGQDFLKWFIDKRGEVLHSDLQGFVWNGKMVDISSLKEGKYLRLQNGDLLTHTVVSIQRIFHYKYAQEIRKVLAKKYRKINKNKLLPHCVPCSADIMEILEVHQILQGGKK